MSILSTSSKLVRVGDSYSAGEGISIDNNVISVTGDYGHSYSAGENISISDDNVISSKDWSSDIDTAAQNVSAETTAWVSEQGYITDASLSDYALITDLETTSGLLKMDIDTVSGSISGKMDTTAFNNWQNGQYSNDIAGLSNKIDTVSGAVDAISGAVSSLDIPTHQEIIDASGYAYSQSTAWCDNQGYLKEHQPISADEWNSSYETVLANSAQWSENTGDEEVNSAVYNNSAKWNDIEVYQTNSSTYLTAHQDISNKLDTTAFSTVSGTFLTAHQSLDGYLTKTSADTLYQPLGNYALENDLEQVSGDLKDDIDYISGVAITAHQDISNKLDTTAFSTVSCTFLTAHQDLSNYATTGELDTASSFLSGAIDYISGVAVTSTAGLATTGDLVQVSGEITGLIPSTAGLMQESELEISDNKITGYNGTAFAGQGGGSIDTIPVAVISPLVTGFSGESAYLGIESTALNLSSYVPVSAIGVNSQGYVSGISGKNISAYYSRNALTANYANTADRAYHDRNNNEITSYYQPKLTITGDAGTITSINGSAVGASIPEGWELVAGTGISIVDDAENNQTTISVTAAGGNPEVESYVQTNSASIDDAVLTYQTNSGSYITQETDWTNTITAASSYAFSEATALIPTDYYTTANPSGFITNVSAENTYQTIAEMTAYQPVGSYATTGELDTASGFLSGAIDYVSGNVGTTYTGDVQGALDEVYANSANWDDATTTYQTNSASYMVESNLEYNSQGYINGYAGSAVATIDQERQWFTHDDTLTHLSNSSQYALGINMSAISADLARMMGVDETVLFVTASYNNNLSSIPLSEPVSAFDRIRIYDSKSHMQDFWWDNALSINSIMFEHNTSGNRWVTYWVLNSATTQDITYVSGWVETVTGGIPQSAGLTPVPVGAPYGRFVHPMKVVGIGRKN